MMSPYRMNKEQMLKFVRLYKQYDNLWDTNSPLYKNREARYQTMKTISEEIGIVGFGPREVAQKIKNLRSTYFQEIKKIICSEKQSVSGGRVYKPRLSWFEVAREIFSKHPHPDLNITNQNSGEELDMTSEKNLTNENPFYNLQLDLVKDEVFERLPSQLEDDLYNYCDSQSKNDSENLNRVSKMIEKLENIARAVQPTKDLNEYETFGQYIALALKTLPAENAITAQAEIFKVIATEKKKVLCT